MKNKINLEGDEPMKKVKRVKKSKRISLNQIESLSTNTSSSYDEQDQTSDGNFDLSNNLPVLPLPETNIIPHANLTELLTSYIKTVPSLAWFPVPISILSLAITPDNPIPSHILLKRSNDNSSALNFKNTTCATLDNTTTANVKRGRSKRNSSNKRSKTSAKNVSIPKGLARFQNEIAIKLSMASLPRLLVVLDMDETLIHIHTNSQGPYDYTINLLEHSKTEDPRFISCTIHPTMHISLRPGVKEFLRYLMCNGDSYEIALFTAGTQHYADAVLEGLDPDRTIIPPNNRYYRESCDLKTIDLSVLGSSLPILETVIKDSHQAISFLQKDLSKLGWPLSRIVLLDNSLLSFSTHPDNGIWIQSYLAEKVESKDNYGDEDCAFGTALFKFSEVIELLELLKGAEDVRPMLRKQFNLAQLLGKCNINSCDKRLSEYNDVCCIGEGRIKAK